IALSALSINASAGFISQDSGFGVDTITLHEETGLEWLDLTATQGRTVNDVLGQLDTGGDYSGFRHATFDEVITMQEGFGITYNLSSFDHAVGQQNASIAAMANYLDFFGATGTNEDDVFGFGTVVRDNGEDRTFWSIYDNDASALFDTDTGYLQDIFFAQARNISDPFTGQFLVRSDVSQVSEPSTFALLGLGMAGLGFARRKKA
ncbi:hypothetical protein A3729_28980, partial [Oleiphilus sp. HI0043]|uniref:PEP-CTERM sorting domain-containing protein n=2 Tax=Oleiphilus TaxID=141450 RepID=UPI0007C3AE9E